MKEKEFESWLLKSGSKQSTIKSRITNCKKIEKFEGDIDFNYNKDNCKILLEKFKYSTKDFEEKAKTKHNIPIKGNQYTGTSTYRQALGLYIKFRSGENYETKFVSEYNGVSKKNKTDWPTWNIPEETELKEIFKLIAKYAKFISPEIVEIIQKNNIINKNIWSRNLQKNNINPELYIWDNSTCLFPGVRRHSGSSEIAHHRKRTTLDSIPNALTLDDNNYPKQIWSFMYRGKKFANYGPKGYALAHLIDHKEIKREFIAKNGFENYQPFGLYTAITNSIYLPTSLLRPTDFSLSIRSLLIDRAIQLYGSIGKIFPDWMERKENLNVKWELEEFEWGETVGVKSNIESFLKFRYKTMKELM